MKIDKVILDNDSQFTKVVMNDSYVLEGVHSISITQRAGEPPKLTIEVDMTDVYVVR